MDLSNAQGLGFWLKGDGKGEIVNIVLRGRSYEICLANHYVKVDFTGWRYIEFQESSTVEFEECSWPFARCHYAVYREEFNFAKAQGLDIWVNNVRKGDSILLKLGPIKAIPLVPQHIVKPMCNLLGKVAPVDTAPIVESGRNSVGFRCQRDELRPHARITVMTLSDEMFGDVPDAKAPAWGRGCLAAPEYGTRSFAPADSEEKSYDFLTP